jgi:hypothetical protein
MALSERAAEPGLEPIADEVAEHIARLGLEPGDGTGEAVLRVDVAEHVRRVVQVYWTPFQAEVPGRSIALHLEVAEPRLRWAEAYCSPEARSWYFSFFQREDDEIQLAYYQECASAQECVEAFFNSSGWYVLTAADKTWDDVTYTIGPGVPWGPAQQQIASTELDAALQEALKKSSIVWLRYEVDGSEHTLPVWYVADKDTMYVLSGEREQTLPGAERIRRAEVIFRWKGRNARVAEVPASVRLVEPGPRWDEVADKIAEKRLNIPGLPEDTARRWRDECHILELRLQA